MKSPKFLVIVKVVRDGSHLNPIEIKTEKMYSEPIPYGARRHAADHGIYLGKVVSKAGNVFWRRLKADEVPVDYEYSNGSTLMPTSVVANPTVEATTPSEYTGYVTPSDEDVRTAIKNAISLKPKTLILAELKWKYAVHSALRGQNIIFTGYSGFGKTLTGRTIGKVLGRPFFKFNLGATQDARATLIGNTHFNKETGTYFVKSEFIKAITTPGAVILLDEITRANPDAENILMTILDPDQRYVRLDEDPKTPVINVAPGVTFFTTANVGGEYTATRIIDRATKDRFPVMIEMDIPTEAEEFKLLKLLYPEINQKLIKGIVAVAGYTRKEATSEAPTLTTMISIRSTVAQVSMLNDGFTFSEVMEASVVNMFSGEGGADSERTHLLQFIQQYSNLDAEPLFEKDVVKEPKKEKKEKEEVEPVVAGSGDLFHQDDLM